MDDTDTPVTINVKASELKALINLASAKSDQLREEAWGANCPELRREITNEQVWWEGLSIRLLRHV